MSNHLLGLLSQWYPQRDQCDWVLGTVYRTEGPAYRKAGAMMLFGSEGQQLGMLSGGCLESDIHRHARKVSLEGRAVTISYDGTDEDDISFQLGIGCGGTVHILLQPVYAANHYLELTEVYRCLMAHGSGHYFQSIPDQKGLVQARFEANPSSCVNYSRQSGELMITEQGNWLKTPVTPPPHLLIAGGGIDARPMAAIAHELGWRVTVWDPRPANGRKEYFRTADTLLSVPVHELIEYARQETVHAAVLMTHNISMDAEVLRMLGDYPLSYLALLGPVNRKQQVLERAGVTVDRLRTPVAGPAGLYLGGQLPETIALSILAECQAMLEQGTGHSISGILTG
ncbi:XdhC/CoxI family protein [Neptuniibacter sp. CAU 1671]|uniref:XdhC family protein n=1 Tax=Neptuniibacter sp. CAU 1671 TaxID=3032593 RepID=UPI0023DA3597|nr:XdhC/CoxI family protein [Neptuniibacter sp. CAU 1671]MDF2180605.1 XdhC family protein [Neptuniibacter sp. CAU 1671]